MTLKECMILKEIFPTTIFSVKLMHDCIFVAGKPIHQLFDLICGVSTGAIIASLLGFHRFPLDKVENIYNSVGTNVFR